jgi:kynureninase
MPADDRSRAEALDAGDPLAAFRDRFACNDDGPIYLDGNSLGRLPLATRTRIAEVVGAEWGTGLVRSWAEWIDQPRRCGDLVGERLLGAAPGQVLICDSTTVNLYKLACAALDARVRRKAQPSTARHEPPAGQPDTMREARHEPGGTQPAEPGGGRAVIVTDDDNFPTDRYVLEGVAAAQGAELRIISTDIDQGLSEDTLREALDGLAGQCALVCLSHVAYRSGALADMARITGIVHDAGALVLWDLCHSAGAVPVELDACRADLAVGCTYKYLNAGPGAPAFLYVRSGLQHEMRQPVWGWFGQADQFAMGQGYRPAPGIDSFLTGTPNIIGTAAVEEGARLLSEAGIGRLRAKGIALTGYLIDLADTWLEPHGFSVASPRDAARRGSHVTLRHPDAWRISQALIRAGVIGDYRTPDRLRLGPAPAYTRYVDIWDALDRLRTIMAEGAYLALDTTRGRVT